MFTQEELEELLFLIKNVPLTIELIENTMKWLKKLQETIDKING